MKASFSRSSRRRVTLLVCCFLLSFPTLSPAAPFRAGAAAVDITPTNLPIRTAGNLTLTVVNKVRDPLHVRALVLDDGATRLAIAVVDSCLVTREDLDEAKRQAHSACGIPIPNMLISATHTHTAPAVYSCHGNDAEPEYRAFLIARIWQAIALAAENLAPARAAWGRAELPEFVHCRRWLMRPGTALHPNPAFTGQATNLVMMNPGYANTNKIRQTGPVDPAVTVLSIQTREGKPLALLANYSTHYGPVPSDAISADYFGEFCRLVEREMGSSAAAPRFVALMSNGTSGDANWIDATQPPKTYSMTNQAATVARAALQAIQGTAYRDDLSLAMREKRVTFNVRLPTREQVAEAREYLATKVGNRPTRTWEENYARETTLMADWPAKSEIKLQAIRIGDFVIGGIPCETYGSTGLAIKNASPFPLTMLISLANGAHGYLPPPDQFALGGYTTWRARSSYLEVGAEPRIKEELLGLLRQVHAHKP